MYEPVLRKLRLFGDVELEDERSLVRIFSGDARHIPAGFDLIVEGETPKFVHLITSGFACRYKILADGRRQIVAFLVPGDFCHVHSLVVPTADHSIATMVQTTVVEISKRKIEEIMALPSLIRPMLMASLVGEATLREWIANIGQRPAPKRLAHLFCELHVRMHDVGLVTDDSFELPLTQTDLGDTLGLSTVHVNRSMKELRHRRLLTSRRRSVVIHDLAELVMFCDFRSNYLHLGRGADRNQGLALA